MAGVNDNLIPPVKGEIRNPKGKPKGTKHINTIVQELLNDEKFTAFVRDGIQLKEYKGAPIKAMVKAQILLAVNGDTKAYDSLVKSGWSQKVENEFSGEHKVIVETRHAARDTD